jgi:hypothetical protein
MIELKLKGEIACRIDFGNCISMPKPTRLTLADRLYPHVSKLKVRRREIQGQYRSADHIRADSLVDTESRVAQDAG